MKNTFKGKVLRDDQIITINTEEKSKVISNIISKFIKANKETWIKNPGWLDN
jgi:hypothetical protein